MPKWEQAALCCPQLRTCYGSLHRVTGGEVRRNLQSSSGLAQMEPPVLHFVPSASCPYLSSRRLLNLLLKLAFEAARQWLFFFNSPNYVAFLIVQISSLYQNAGHNYRQKSKTKTGMRSPKETHFCRMQFPLFVTYSPIPTLKWCILPGYDKTQLCTAVFEFHYHPIQCNVLLLGH